MIDKFAGPTGQRHVKSCTSCFFYYRFISCFYNWPPPWDPESCESVLRCPLGDPGMLQVSILSIFRRLKSKSKKYDFPKLQQSTTMIFSIDPGAPRGSIFYVKVVTLSHPFWHQYFPKQA